MRKFKTRILKIIPLLVLAISASQLAAQDYPDPTRFEDAIKRFEEQDRMHQPPEGAIVLTGSSSIARWNDQAVEALAPLTVIPRGFGGTIMHDLVHYLDRVALTYEPRAILIYEGDNDTGVASYGLTPDHILGNLKTIVGRIHDELPETRIYVLSVKPSILRESVWSTAQQVNAGYKAIADSDPLVFYVDVANPFLDVNGKVMTDIFVEDGLHLNDLGNSIWGAAIKAALMPMEARHEAKFK